MIYHHTREFPHPRRHGWTVKIKFYVPPKADGTPDRRASPRPSRGVIHYHENGHKRIYLNNVLYFEKYEEK